MHVRDNIIPIGQCRPIYNQNRKSLIRTETKKDIATHKTQK